MDIKKTNKPIELLLIEDNPGDLLLTKRMLEKAQYTAFDISYANNLSSGIDCAMKNKIDVILSDLNLPDSPDVDTFHKLKLQVPEIPTNIKEQHGYLINYRYYHFSIVVIGIPLL